MTRTIILEWHMKMYIFVRCNISFIQTWHNTLAIITLNQLLNKNHAVFLVTLCSRRWPPGLPVVYMYFAGNQMKMSMGSCLLRNLHYITILWRHQCCSYWSFCRPNLILLGMASQYVLKYALKRSQISSIFGPMGPSLAFLHSYAT